MLLEAAACRLWQQQRYFWYLLTTTLTARLLGTMGLGPEGVVLLTRHIQLGRFLVGGGAPLCVAARQGYGVLDSWAWCLVAG